MKISQTTRLVWLLSLLSVSAVAAHAATLTAVNVDSGERNLFSFMDEIYGAQNYLRLDDDLDGVWDARDIIGATAIASTARAVQQLGVCVLCDGSDSFTFGSAVTQSGRFSIPLFDDVFASSGPNFRWFDAAAGDPAVGTVYSDPLLNAGGTDHMVSFAIVDRPGVYVLAFEDWLSSYRTRASDRDFNDFLVEVRLAPPADLITNPEPMSFALFGGALLALGFSRRFRRPLAR